MKLSTIILPMAILTESSMVTGQYAFKDKRRTNPHNPIHYSRSSRKLKKTTKVVKDHIYVHTGKAPKSFKSSNQTPNKITKSSKSMWSSLQNLENEAAAISQSDQSTYNGDETKISSPSKTPKSSKDAGGVKEKAPKSGKSYSADEYYMPSASKTSKSNKDGSGMTGGVPKSGKSYSADEYHMPSASKTSKSSEDASGMTEEAPKSGKSYYPDEYYMQSASKSPSMSRKSSKSARSESVKNTKLSKGASGVTEGAPKSGKSYSIDEVDMPSALKSNSVSRKSSKGARSGSVKSTKGGSHFMYKKTKTTKKYPKDSRTEEPDVHYYYTTEEPSLHLSHSAAPSSPPNGFNGTDIDRPSEVPSMSSVLSQSSYPSTSLSALITEYPSQSNAPSTSTIPSESTSMSDFPSTSSVPSTSLSRSLVPSESSTTDLNGNRNEEDIERGP